MKVIVPADECHKSQKDEFLFVISSPVLNFRAHIQRRKVLAVVMFFVLLYGVLTDFVI
jgi:hypothetical protein